MKIAAVVEARMTSSRLPGKVLMEVLQKPLLGYLIDRLKKVSIIDVIILATTVNDEDNILEEFAKNQSILHYRGSEENVMKRVLDAARYHEVDVIVEITGDCPIIDPDIVNQVTTTFLNNEADYVNNTHIRSYPDGMDVQVFYTNTLEESYNMTNDPLDREHVTLHIRNNPEVFRNINLIAPSELVWPELGLTLDEESDFELLKEIIENFEPHFDFTCNDVINFLRKNPELIKLNQAVSRKGDS